MNPVDRIIKETKEAREAGKWVTVDIAILADEIEKLREDNERLKKENKNYHIKYVLGLTQGH